MIRLGAMIRGGARPGSAGHVARTGAGAPPDLARRGARTGGGAPPAQPPPSWATRGAADKRTQEGGCGGWPERRPEETPPSWATGVPLDKADPGRGLRGVHGRTVSTPAVGEPTGHTRSPVAPVGPEGRAPRAAQGPAHAEGVAGYAIRHAAMQRGHHRRHRKAPAATAYRSTPVGPMSPRLKGAAQDHWPGGLEGQARLNARGAGTPARRLG